ncbi:attractin-like protein 1 isoform X2 [Pocillopora verrucosa]|uniref:attractin-like protein 1 isoform X2 n=1 Tax=Pocillopora verrucosa TaxID=203993 RepID=UPI00333F1E91
MGKRMNALRYCFVIYILSGSILCELSKCTLNPDHTEEICNGGGSFYRIESCRERHGESDVNIPVTPKPSRSAWLIETDEPKNNRSVILNIIKFSRLCGNMKLYIYDGTSVRSPLIAIYSNLIKARTREKPSPLLQATSGSALIVLSRRNDKIDDCCFVIKYSFEEKCPIECGRHGLCSKGICNCSAGWTSRNCSLPTCPVVCNNGSCDAKTRKCNCASGYSGESCNITDNRNFWSSPVANNQDALDGVSSHAMAVVGNYIWVFGGFSLSKGPLDVLARYNIRENRWEIIQASTEKHQRPSARYGHSLVAYDNHLILFGGTCKKGAVSNETWILNTTSRQWTLLRSSVDIPVGVSGHTATVVENEMIVLFGYNPEQGVSNLIQVFGLVDRVWRSSKVDSSIVRPTYGHSSVLHPGTGRIYVHGGYRMLNSSCYRASSETFYYESKAGKWYQLRNIGIPRFLHSAVIIDSAMIIFGGRGEKELVSRHLMVFDINEMKWKFPINTTVPKTASRYGHSSVVVDSIMYAFGGFAGLMFNSFLQYSQGDCMSPGSSLNCFEAFPTPSVLLKPLVSSDSCTSRNPSSDQCHLRHTCADCLRGDSDDSCLWCETLNQCVSKVTLRVTFPYQQCMQILERGTGACSDLQCANVKTCRDCSMLPGCGWCDDGSGTGSGRCMPGGKNEPFLGSGDSYADCSKSRWNFINCPACQCNGHSKCVEGNRCENCEDNTAGAHCERCADGYYGDPRNGGKCADCRCSSQTKLCDSEGKCRCLALGATGNRCDRCVPGYNRGGDFCYYNFLGSKKDFNVTGFKTFNFEYTLKEEKRSVSVEIKWKGGNKGSKARVNITMGDNNKEEIKYGHEKVPFTTEFRYNEYEFGSDGITIRGYIYDIESGDEGAFLRITIENLAETIDLLEFFLTFFGCFLSLLLMAGIVWKVRNRYISYILNRQRREERQKMASRPFARVSVFLHAHNKSTPGPVAVETCENGKASVLTVLMRLPGTEDGLTPIGQSGLCFASVLGTHTEQTTSAPAPKATRIRTTKRCASTCV